MTIRAQRWDVTAAEARAIQQRLRGRVERQDRFGRIRRVAGADVAFGGGRAHAAVLVFAYPEMRLLETAHAAAPLRFPYVPGLLSFREGPALLRAFAALTTRPDVILFDAQGLAHPRRFGLACHMGVLLNRPSVGCAKSVLVGEWDRGALGEEHGAWTALVLEGKRVGAAVRTREGARPVFVSIGHRISLPSAIRLALACCAGYRIPEPTRQADIAVAQLAHGAQRCAASGGTGRGGGRAAQARPPDP